MSIETNDIQPRVSAVDFSEDELAVSIEDGRVVLAPLAWYPRLLHATESERKNWRVFKDTAGQDII